MKRKMGLCYFELFLFSKISIVMKMYVVEERERREEREGPPTYIHTYFGRHHMKEGKKEGRHPAKNRNLYISTRKIGCYCRDTKRSWV